MALLYPLILAKTRVQTSNTNTKSIRAVLEESYRLAGVAGLYHGIEIVLIKGFLNQGWTMMTKQRYVCATIIYFGLLCFDRAFFVYWVIGLSTLD